MSVATMNAPEMQIDELPAENPTGKVAYLVARFPKLTETFVLYEVLAVEAEGTPIEVYPLLSASNAATKQGSSVFGKFVELLRKPGPPPVMHADVHELVRRAHYHPLFSWNVLCALVSTLFTRPMRTLGALGTLIRANLGSAKFLFGGLALFPKAVFIARQMERDGITHLHAHFANHATAAAFVVHRVSGIPYSFTAHGSDLHMDRHMLREKVREAARVITISHYNAEIIAAECGPAGREKTEVIRCGVDTSVFRPSPLRSRSAGDPLNVICIGTMHEVKGQEYLIEAARLLRDRNLPIHLHFVGHGPDAGKLREQVAAAGLGESVTFHGVQPRSRVTELLAQCDVLCAPSVPTADGRREGIPVVIMEAMGSGRPVVSTRLSGIPEIVLDGENGLLVEPRDAMGIADALAKLHCDPSLSERFAAAGRAKVLSEFDLRTNAALLAERFQGGGKGQLRA